MNESKFSQQKVDLTEQLINMKDRIEVKIPDIDETTDTMPVVIISAEDHWFKSFTIDYDEFQEARLEMLARSHNLIEYSSLYENWILTWICDMTMTDDE